MAGPVVSLGLGTVFLAGALVAALPDAVDGVVFWLGYVNFVLLAFNLLPALPLDGGRVLRALLWARSGDFGRAPGRRRGSGCSAWAVPTVGGGAPPFAVDDRTVRDIVQVEPIPGAARRSA